MEELSGGQKSKIAFAHLLYSKSDILLLDEPGQHSMALNSQRMLFKKLAETQNLQSIVAASFDNDEGNFNQVTSGLNFKLISWDEKLIKPLI